LKNKKFIEMEKKIIRKNIGEEKTFDADSYRPKPTTIDEVLQWLNKSKKQGATHIYWYARAYDDDTREVEAQAYLEYEETDEECLAREAKEKEDRDKKAAEQLQYEKRQYELLKQKFENGK
jgi:hypothetical protein